MLKLRSIGVRDYSVFGRTRFAGERIPGVWLWNVSVHLTGGLPMGSARDLDTAKAEFGGARSREGQDHALRCSRRPTGTLTFATATAEGRAPARMLRNSGMLKQIMAEIIFRNPGDMNPAIAELIEFDFEVRILDDWIDDDGPAVWIVATTLSGLSQSAFFHSVRAIIEPLGGDVVEAGLAPDDLEAWIASKT